MLKEKRVSKMSFYSNIVVLQGCPEPLITFYILHKTSLFGRDLCNNHTIMILISFFKENENKDLKIIISYCITVLIASAISVQIIAIRFFLKKLCSPTPNHMHHSNI